MDRKKIIMPRQPLYENHEFPADFNPLLKRIYLNRGVNNQEEIKTELSGLLSYHDLLNIDKAAELLALGIKENKKFLIIGDFDADGATSTAVAVGALKKLGAQHVEYLIPNRFQFGYGLTPEIVDVAASKNPDILITVDNGISNHEGVKRAKSYGMKVLITDHHLAPEVLPDADVIINPNQPNDKFLSKNLAGVGVIFYVMLALRKYLNSKIILSDFLDLVALGTVADVVPLDKNNRILVSQGLKRIRHGLVRPGILALLKISGRNIQQLSPSDLGFCVAPRLNAAGRLDDMSIGVACLLSEDDQTAFKLAQQLDQLNRERRDIQEEMLIQTENIPEGLCIYHADFHQGVIGILAGKLKDKYHKPVIVFSKVSDAELKGSGRSIPNIHLRDLLVNINTKYPHLIQKFGGHAMAAGLSILEKNFEIFSNIFNQVVNQLINQNNIENILLTDGELKPEEFSEEMAELLKYHSPWGQGFPEPLFNGQFEIVDQKLINDKHLKLTVKPTGENFIVEALWFYNSQFISAKNIHMAYRLETNTYQNTKKIQLIIEHIEK